MPVAVLWSAAEPARVRPKALVPDQRASAAAAVSAPRWRLAFSRISIPFSSESLPRPVDKKEKHRVSSQVSLVFYKSNWKYQELVKKYEVWQEISDDIQCNEWLWKVLGGGRNRRWCYQILCYIVVLKRSCVWFLDEFVFLTNATLCSQPQKQNKKRSLPPPSFPIRHFYWVEFTQILAHMHIFI